MKRYIIVMLAVLALCLGLAGPAGAAPITVCASGCDYTTIEAAIAAANPGDTINVAAGTYVGSGQIVISKNLSIVGANKLTTIIKPGFNTGSDGDPRGWWLVNPGVTFNLSNVTLDGAGWQVFSAIRTKGSGTIDNNIIKNIAWAKYLALGLNIVNTNVTVSNNTFSNIERVGIHAFGAGATNVVITGNTYTGKGAVDSLDYGIEIGGGAKATITNNTITNNKAVASSDGSTSAAILVTTYFDPGTEATITGNTLTGNTAGIVVGYDGADTSTVVAHFNDLSGNTDVAIETTAPAVDASGNWFGASLPAAVKAAVRGAIDYTPWLGSGTDTSSDAGFQGDFSTLWVDDDSPQTGAIGRIQEAVNLVSGSTVNVAAGTYADAVSLNGKNGLTLQGSDPADRPVLTSGINSRDPSGITLRNLIVRGVVPSTNYVINAAGVNFTMEKVTVDGEGVAGRFGVAGGQINGDVSVTYSEFLNIAGWAAFDTRSGSGGPTGGADLNNVVFSHNTVRNSQAHINIRGTLGDPAASVTMSDNLVELTGIATSSFGGVLKVFYATNLTFTGNTVKDVGTSGYNPAGEAPYGAGFMPRGVANMTVTGNTFENNNQAIAIEPRNGEYGAFHDGVLPNGTISNNTFINNKYGLYVPATLHPTSNFAGLLVNDNTFSGSVAEAVHNGFAAGTLNAENNWWNSAAGPGTVGPGTGDHVSSYVDFSPWCGDVACSFVVSTNAAGEYVAPAGATPAQVQALIDAVPSGSIILLAAETYAGGFSVPAGVTLKGQPGTIVGHGSPAFHVTGDDVTIESMVLDGGGDASSAILVDAGLQRLYVHDLEIRNWDGDGIHFSGGVSDVKIINNYIHNNTGDGIDLPSAPAGVAQVYGNSLRANGGLGINLGSGALTAEYNEWGDVGGANSGSGDGAAAGVDFDRWTFGKLWVDAPANVRETETVVVTVKVDAKSLYGANFKVTFPTAKLQLTANPVIGSFQTFGAGSTCTVSSMASANASGEISFLCNRALPDAEYDALGDALLTLSFQALEFTGVSQTADIAFLGNTAGLAAVGGVGIHLDAALADTITILGTTTVSGRVDLQGRGDDSGAVVDPDAGSVYGLNVGPVTTNSWGAYSFSNLTDDTYVVRIEMSLYLDRTRTVVVAGDTLTLPDVALLGGDANDDDTINVQDLTIIGGQFGKASTDPTLDARANINNDLEVNILDLVLAAGNYELSSGTW